MATTARNGKLQEALVQLIGNQAQFVSHLDEDRRRFSRIEQELFEVKTLLLQHDQVLKNHDQTLKDLLDTVRSLQEMLKNLPEAIRQKIGFQRK